MKLHRRLTQRRLFIEGGGRPFIKSRRRLFYLTHITHICQEKAVCWGRLFIERGGHVSREEADHWGGEEAICWGRPFIGGGHSLREAIHQGRMETVCWRQEEAALPNTHNTQKDIHQEEAIVEKGHSLRGGHSLREGAIHWGREEAICWGRESIHWGRGETICWGRGKAVHRGRGETIHWRQEEAVWRVETVCWGQEEAHRRRLFIGRRPFIRRRLFVERAHSLRANSLREKAVHWGREGQGQDHLLREEAVHWRPFTEGGRRPFIEAGGNICQETWLFVVLVGRKNNELLHWEIHDCMMSEFEWTSWIVTHKSQLGDCVWLFLNCLNCLMS